jgi:hypothetical protein
MHEHVDKGAEDLPADTRTWGPLKRAYAEAAASVEDVAIVMQAEARRSSTFNVMREARAIPWTLFSAPLLVGWEKSAARALALSRRAELKARGSRIRKDRMPAEGLGAVTDEETLVALSEELAQEWLQTRGLLLVQRLSEKAARAIEETLRDGMREGWSIQRMTREIRNVVGLSDKDAAALRNRRRQLVERGVKPARVQSDLDRYRKQLIRRRAETIARTEVVAARNQGQLHAWKIMQESGELPSVVRRVWIPALSERTCPVCMTLGSVGPVLLGQPFTSPDVGRIMAPPAHPNCRCSMGLV